MQDWLHLDNRARMNTPNTSGSNWKWRMPADSFTDRLAHHIASQTSLYGRSRQKEN